MAASPATSPCRPSNAVLVALEPDQSTPTTVAGGTITPYRWVIAAGLVTTNWAMSLPFISLGLLLPAIRDSFGLSDTEAGWLGSSLVIGTTISALPAALVLSRYNARWLSVIAVGLGAALTFAHGAAPFFAVLLLARVALGLSYSVRNTARAMLVSLWFPLREIPMVNGITVGLIGVSEFLALILTPIILDATGSWRTTYFIYAAFAAVIFLLWLTLSRDRYPENDQQRQPANWSTIKSVLRHRQLWVAGFGLMGAMYGWTAFATFWPTYMLDTNEISLKRTGLFFGLNSAASIPATIFLGFYASKVRNRQALLVVCGLGMAATFAGMVLTTSTWALVLLSIASGFTWGFLPIIQTLPYEIRGVNQQELALNASLLWTFLFAGGILGPITVGLVSDISGSLFGALMVAAIAPVTLAFALGVPGRRPRTAPSVSG